MIVDALNCWVFNCCIKKFPLFKGEEKSSGLFDSEAENSIMGIKLSTLN